MCETNYKQIKVEKEFPHNPSKQFFECIYENVTKYKCAKCAYSTHLKTHVSNHEHNSQKSTEPRKSYNCQKCKKFKTFSALIFISHKYGACKQVSQEGAKPKGVVWYRCQQCPFQTKKKYYVKIHNQRIHLSEGIWFQCAQCGHKTRTTTGMKIHKEAHHTAPENIKRFQCDQCPFKTNVEFYLRKHVKRHSRIILTCDQCHYTCLTKTSMTYHIKTKHGKPGEKIVLKEKEEKWFNCKSCSFKTKHQSNVRTHFIVHHMDPENIKWFQCEQCSFKAKLKRDLSKHIWWQHLSPKDIVWAHCEFCDYKTKQRRDLRNHVKTKHSDKRNLILLKCDQCEYTAKVANTLGKHMKRKHSEKTV